MPRQQPAVEAMTRLVDSNGFERVLRCASRASTSHFAVHHLAASAGALAGSSPGPRNPELSTIGSLPGARAVDDSLVPGSGKQFGVVVPKRHARRAVTRSLLKRQIYAAGNRHAALLPVGLWIVRLRAPFDRAAFPSAASAALRSVARAELETLFGAVTRRQAS